MDVTGRNAGTVLRDVHNIFAGHNDATLHVRDNKIYPLVCVAHYFRSQGHAVEWRHDGYTSLWISKRRSRTVIEIRRRPQIEECKAMILRHNILEISFTARGEMPINWLWSLVLWAVNHGFVFEEQVKLMPDNMYQLKVNLRRPHDALPDMLID